MNNMDWLQRSQGFVERANARGMGIVLDGLPENDLQGIYRFLCRWEAQRD
jgi:hypothetical protein